jgi:hypothetical protein
MVPDSTLGSDDLDENLVKAGRDRGKGCAREVNKGRDEPSAKIQGTSTSVRTE